MPRPFLFRWAFSSAMSHAHASLALRVFLQILLVCAESCWLGFFARAQQTGCRQPQGWAVKNDNGEMTAEICKKHWMSRPELDPNL
jgi:hypothetical protein